jgi:CRISPR/Cas system-associated exonuclease Cas4 (RecB family)
MIKLSHSSFCTYEECPQKFLLKHVLYLKPFIPMRWPLVIGVAFHNLVNQMYTACDFSYQFLRRGWKKCFMDAMEKEASAFQSTEGWGEHRQAGSILIATFYKFAKENGYLVRPMATEWTFEIEYQGFKIKGIIDLILQKDNGQVHILDFKTGWAAVSADKLAVYPQLTLYHWGVKQVMGITADRVGLFFPRKRSVLLSTRTESDHIQLLDEYVKIASSITKEDFHPEYGHCARCEMSKLCPHFKQS